MSYPRVNFGYNSSHFFVTVARQFWVQFFSLFCHRRASILDTILLTFSYPWRVNFEYKFVQCRFRVVAEMCKSTYNNITHFRNILSRGTSLLSIAPVRSNGRQSTVVASSVVLLPRVAACCFRAAEMCKSTYNNITHFRTLLSGAVRYLCAPSARWSWSRWCSIELLSSSHRVPRCCLSRPSRSKRAPSYCCCLELLPVGRRICVYLFIIILRRLVLGHFVSALMAVVDCWGRGL
jgi:hypothetical protein